MPGLARGGGDLGRRAGRDGPRAAASGAPAAAAPAAWPGPAPPARGGGMRLPAVPAEPPAGDRRRRGLLFSWRVLITQSVPLISWSILAF